MIVDNYKFYSQEYIQLFASEVKYQKQIETGIAAPTKWMRGDHESEELEGNQTVESVVERQVQGGKDGSFEGCKKEDRNKLVGAWNVV